MKTDYIKTRKAITDFLLLIQNDTFKKIDIDLLTVLKALNKQIPNAPIQVERNKASGMSVGYDFKTEYDCPCCRKVNLKKGQKYCDGCGQALKWENTPAFVNKRLHIKSEVEDND